MYDCTYNNNYNYDNAGGQKIIIEFLQRRTGEALDIVQLLRRDFGSKSSDVKMLKTGHGDLSASFL